MKNHNLPDAFVQRMEQLLGSEAEALFEALETEPPVGVRFNQDKIPDPELSELPLADKIPWAENGYYLSSRPIFTLDPLFHAGAYYVQDPSSMFVEQVLKQFFHPNHSTRILDMAAAPGGKSTAIASFLNGNGLLVANEIIGNRNVILQENLIKWGHSNIVVTQNDPKHFERLGEQFDIVLVDAPCSGEGLFRKDPEAVNHWSPEAVQQCAWRQTTILESAVAVLKEGGILIYSTCTFEPEENERQLEKQIEQGLDPLNITPDQKWQLSKTSHGGWRFWPHQTKGEGFFIAALQKPFSSHPSASTRRQLPVSRSKIDLSPFLEGGNLNAYQFRQDQVLFPEAHFDFLALLFEHLNVRIWGTKAGTVKGKDLIPSHELALSLSINKATPSIDLNKEQALKYLRREEFKAPASEKGFHLVNYLLNGNNFPLGWAKVLPNRVNNLYPMNWRIRMR